MICPRCGKQISNDSNFCNYCNARIAPINQNVMNNNGQFMQHQVPPKKGNSGKTIVIIIVIIVVCLLGCCGFSSLIILFRGSDDRNNSSSINKDLPEGSTTSTQLLETTTTKIDSREQKNGFDANTNTTVQIAHYSFSIPEYWKCDKNEGNNFIAYAENSGKTAMFQIQIREDKDDPVDFEILEKETNDGRMEKSFKSMFSSCGEVTTEQFTNSTGIKGYIYSADGVMAGINCFSENFVFPSEIDNSWAYITLMQTDNTEFSYTEDFRKMIDSIRFEDSIEDTTAVEDKTYSEPIDGIRPEIKEAIDGYETYIDDYCAFMTKYTSDINSSNTAAMLNDYLSYLQKLNEYSEKFDALDETELSDEERKYYLDVQLRCSEKLLKTSYGMAQSTN